MTCFGEVELQKAFFLPEHVTSVPRKQRSQKVRVPSDVVGGSYRCSPPLIRPSKLTSKEKGGIGKNLSGGWNLNFAVGCTHGCPFCYVDSIHKRFGVSRYGESVLQDWGNYLLIPENLNEAIERTPWERWQGIEVMMSSTHDPYLPKLAQTAHKILEHALSAGVHLCIQTRSCLVLKDLDLLTDYRDQIRLQVSIATANRKFARLIEPRVPSPERRLEVLKQAKEIGLKVGVIIAPLFPNVDARPDFRTDLESIANDLEKIKPDNIYGECFHVRGFNVKLMRRVLGQSFEIDHFDSLAGKYFKRILKQHNLQGEWWFE